MSFFKNWITFLMILVVVAASSQPVKAKDEYNPIIQQDKGSGGISLFCQTPEAVLTPVVIDERDFQEFNVHATGIAGEPGGPRLPAWSHWIEVPDGMQPVLHYKVESVQVIREIDIAPFPTLGSGNPYIENTETISTVHYSLDSYQPSQPASVTKVITVGTKRMALVDITPYRYNPVQRELHVAEQITIDISFEPGETLLPNLRERSAPVYRELDRALSSEAPYRDDFGTRMDLLGHYVVVVHDEDLIEVVEPFIEWKKLKGYMVTIANLEEIGRRAEELETWLQEAWDEWDIPPTYVLLTGDATGPTAIAYFDDRMPDMQSWHISDNQYVAWEGEHGIEQWIPEGFIGRFAPETVSELEHIVNKALCYERTPFTDEPWVEGGVLIGNGVQSCISTNVAVKELMLGVGYIRDNIYETYAMWPQQPDHRPIYNGMENGVGFVNFRGYQRWGEVTINIIRGFNNDWMLPVVTGMVCETNDFANAWGDSRPECRGEAWQRAWRNNRPNGGICCFGPTDLNTHTWFNNTLNCEFYNLLLNKNIHTIGALCLGTKLSLLRNYPSCRSLGDGNTDGYYFYTYTLLGDPGMQVWSKDPVLIAVDFSAEKPVGATLFEANVLYENDDEVPGAYIHIFRETDDDEIHYGGYTDETGQVSFIVDPLEEGEYFITVTGPNMVPIEESFDVVETPVYASFTEAVIDDDEDGESDGNSDENINPGETIELAVTLTNAGSERSDGFSVQLRTTSDWVEIVRADTEYPEIEPEEAAVGNEPFILRFAPEMPDGYEFDMQLRIDYGEELWRESFKMFANAYRFNLWEMTFLEEGIAPGVADELVVTVENIGELDTAPIRAILYCNNPKIQIRQAESFLGEIPQGERCANSQFPFEIFAAVDAYPGSEISFGLLLRDDAGLRDSLLFTTVLNGPMETAPQGPTAYGYWAFDSRDTTGGMNPEYDWIDGNENLRLVDNNDALAGAGTGGSRAHIELPFEFIYFDKRVTTATVGTNGWMAFARSDQVCWNNQEIGSGLAPPAMLCPYWTDIWSGSVLTRYDEENARFIIEWRNYRDNNGTHRFAVHLYDPATLMTRTGDGEFFFVYHRNHEGMFPGRDVPQEAVTIGFCSPDRGDGMTITHARMWDPRTDDIEGEIAIRFTTGPFTEFGSVHGRIIDVEHEEPMARVRVMIDGTGFFGLTDVNGEYSIQQIPVGTYSVTAQMRYFNDATSADIQIVEDEPQLINFEMTYPTFNIDIEEINYQVWPDSTDSTGFEVWNDGNGPLDYRLVLNYNAEAPEEIAEWDVLFDYAVGDTVDDAKLQGLAFDDEFFYISGTRERNVFPHPIYVFNKQGEFDREFDQFSVDSTIGYGYKDLAFNGENLLAVENRNIIELTLEGDSVRVIPTEYVPTQAVGWSPDRQTIFTRSMTGRVIYEMDPDGNIVNEFQSGDERLYIHALTWFPEDKNGFNLYILCNNRYPDEVGGSRLQLSKLNLETSEFRTVKYITCDGLGENDRPLSCVITKFWDPLLWTFAVLTNITPKDRLFGFELEPNLTWIRYEPVSGQVPPQERQPFMVTFIAEDMPHREYFVIFELYHNAVGDRYDIPVFFLIEDIDDYQQGVTVSDHFTLEVPYPNPFNPSTSFSFVLPKTAEATLNIWDISGRLVDSVELGWFTTGQHSFKYDGSNLSSGVYLAQLTAGTKSAVQKIVLMR